MPQPAQESAIDRDQRIGLVRWIHLLTTVPLTCTLCGLAYLEFTMVFPYDTDSAVRSNASGSS